MIVRWPDGMCEPGIELGPHEAVVIGRAPGAEAAGPDLDGRKVGLLRVGSHAVSSNHALVWTDPGSVAIRDLGSRNGTCIFAPRGGETVRVEAPEVELQLARPVTASAVVEEPRAPSWTTRRDYVHAVADAIEHWMRAQGAEVNVSVAPRSDESEGGPLRVSVATGEALEVVPVGTADASWAHLFERVCAWVVAQNAVFRAEEETRREGMVLASRSMRAAHREVLAAAKEETATLLLMGPSGAGKEKLAEVFHRSSGHTGRFVAVNCSMFSKELLRAELFGTEVGAFTGAVKRIPGAVERAEGGTLFLDEIGEMDLELQPMLLRFVDRREYEHVGKYGEPRSADLRIVAATNRDLRAAARAGTFRADLWFRLSVHVVDVPPLKNRWDDLIAYLESVRVEGGAHSARALLSPEAMDVLRSHVWEGNFRELKNFVQRLPRKAPPGAVDAAMCRALLEKGSLQPVAFPPSTAPPSERPEWSALAARAVEAFVEDCGREPGSWDDQKEWNEKYLKPLLFAHLSGVATAPSPRDATAFAVMAAHAAARMNADRGTAAKQLARYHERYRR